MAAASTRSTSHSADAPCGVHGWLLTPPNPGAVAIIALSGGDLPSLLSRIAKIEKPVVGRAYYRQLAKIDSGIVTLLTPTAAQLMPHGGPRVVERLCDALADDGVQFGQPPEPRAIFPEAVSDFQADLLMTMARSASPSAIDLLLAQAQLWQSFLKQMTDQPRRVQAEAKAILKRSDRWRRLIEPATVVITGRPNVGKSTLTNMMLGRSASVVADLPGTTRDWVGGLAEIGGSHRAAAIRWLDTPGIHHSDDPIEQRAISLAAQLVEQADVVIAMRDVDCDFSDAVDQHRPADCYIVNKVDLLPDEGHATAGRDDGSRERPWRISAATGQGVDALEQHLLAALGLHDRTQPACWAFSSRLAAIAAKAAAQDIDESANALAGYLQNEK